MLAALLQGVPLLGASGCIASGVTDQQASGLAVLLWLSVLLWGLGYAYVGRLARFTVVFLAGPVLAFASCAASFKGVTYDYEHSDTRNSADDVAGANRASIQTGLLLAVAVMILAVDAARLASARNDEFDDSVESDSRE